MKTWTVAAALLFVCTYGFAQTEQPAPSRKPCEDLKAEIAKKLDAKGVTSYTLDVVDKGKEGDGKGFDARDAHMNVHDWRNAEYNKKFEDGELYYAMANGKDRMPAYGKRNTPNEIWLMVDYIRSMRRK